MFRTVRAKRGLGEQVRFVLNIFGGSEGWCHPRIYLYEYKYIFFLKTGNLILNWFPLSFSYNHTMPERLYSQSTLPNYLVWIENNLEVQPRLTQKKQFSIFFSELGKTEKSDQSNIQKLQNLFVNWERLGSMA